MCQQPSIHRANMTVGLIGEGETGEVVSRSSRRQMVNMVCCQRFYECQQFLLHKS